jgi:hypothetical protein
MNKSIIIGSIIALGVIIVLAIANSVLPKSETVLKNQSKSQEQKQSSQFQAAEKIEVVHFHGTQQCWSCITVGEYALKTIKEKFPDEYKNSTIVFKEELQKRNEELKYK